MARNTAYTEGPIGSVMLKTALSMLPGTLAISGYNIVDTYFVSKLGTLPMAAMGFTFPVVMLVGCLFRGLDNGIMTPTAQLLGGGRIPRAARLISSGAILLIIVSLTVGILGSLTIEPVFRNLLKADDSVMGDIRSYMVIWYMGSVTASLSMATNALLVTSGESRLAGIFMLAGLLLNVLLDPIFIFGFKMGVKGAALATILSQAISCVWVLLFLCGKKTYLKLKKHNLRIDAKLVFPCIALGTATFIMQSSESVISVCFNSSLLKYGGDIAVGAMTILTSVMQFAMLPMQGIAQGAQPILSYNFGAKNVERVKKTYKLLLISCLTYFIKTGLRRTPMLL